MSSIKEKIKLEIRDMKKTYPNGDGVEHINIQVHEGEFVTMLGSQRMRKIHDFKNAGRFPEDRRGKDSAGRAGDPGASSGKKGPRPWYSRAIISGPI